MRALLAGQADPADLHVREAVIDQQGCFPVDGYESWQERWLLGTGARPQGW